jgi:hypothetical protein
MIRYFLFIIGILFIGCREEFIIDFGDNEKVLVVDGSITNETGPYTINLSLSSRVANSAIEPYTGCAVRIIDSNGNNELLIEKKPGKYITDVNGIRGEVGMSYKLSVVSSSGKEYETNFQEMQEPVDIDSLYALFENKEIVNDSEGLNGYQFYLNTKESSQKENYFLWQITESYEYSVDFDLYAIRDYLGFKIVLQDTSALFDQTATCWEIENVNTIFTGETSSLTEPLISQQKLNFVGTNSRRLSIRYTANVEQYSITEDAYLFWNKIEAQISEENPLYASQPINIEGNLYNLKNSEETTFGYFTVASVKEKRIFVNRPLNANFNFEVCFVNIDPVTMDELTDENGVVHYVLNQDGIMGSVKKSCFDCRNLGGELTKPIFWID